MGSPTKKKPESELKCERLVAVLRECKSLLIVMQDFPDPDAIAAAAALRELARSVTEVTTTIVCGGFVGRAENLALVKYLGINVQALEKVTLSQFDCVAMVDTQPSAGNNALPDGVVPDIVIDHHPIRPATRKSRYFDIRKHYGATSTICHEYLQCAKVSIPVPVATAMLYGIRSDTADFGRDAIQADINAFLALYPTSNKRILGRIGMARVPREYFQVMMSALRNARSVADCVYTDLGVISNPDMVSEIADLLLRDQETCWAMCCACYGATILVSVRTSDLSADAGNVVHRMVGRLGSGGGHSAMAGGQVPLKETTPKAIRKLSATMVARFLKQLGAAGKETHALVSRKG
jgi:nanoRNase/pAp phosphatase (c-di-AMP/oligoRNAs hydrolase)